LQRFFTFLKWKSSERVFRVRRVSWLQLLLGLGLAVIGSFLADGMEADFAPELRGRRLPLAHGILGRTVGGVFAQIQFVQGAFSEYAKQFAAKTASRGELAPERFVRVVPVHAALKFALLRWKVVVGVHAAHFRNNDSSRPLSAMMWSTWKGTSANASGKWQYSQRFFARSRTAR
jgi:hypothetical protein